MRKKLGILGSILFVSAMTCCADVIGIDLTPSLLSGLPGSVLSFSGALTNTGATTAFLNSAGVNVSGGFQPTDEDISGFFANAPLFLSPGAFTPSISIFTIAIPNSLAGAVYGGTFTVLGGANGDAQEIVGSAAFSVQVSAASNVPEPASMVLFLAGCLSLIGWRAIFRRRSGERYIGSV